MKIKKVVKRSGDIVDFTPERITNAIYRAAVSVGGRDRATAEKLSKQVIALLEEKSLDDYVPTIEEIQDIVEKVLIENGHAKVAKEYILYRDNRARRREIRACRACHPSTNIPWAQIWHSLNWSIEHGINTVSGLNQRLQDGDFPEIINETEALYNQDVENAAESIRTHQEDLKIVIITGPSSSGKTTSTIKIGQRLKRMGFNLVTLNVDNYFFDLDVHPVDEFGDYDFETPQALDLEQINEDLACLISGEEVKIPYYDFKTSRQSPNHTPMKLLPGDIIVIDSLHGLYPEMTRDIPKESKFSVYLEPLLQIKGDDDKYIRWTDIRLIRRMLRDESHRSYDPRRTLEHWHYVRSSELRYIIPNIPEANYILNTGLPYELPIYSARMTESFRGWEEDYRDDPFRQDTFWRASRVHNLHKQITPIEDQTPIPPDSVLREFIGGSCYEY